MNPTSTQVSTKEELLARVVALSPALRERAADAEAQRALPAESVADLLEAGITRTLIPERWGGYGLGLDAWFEVVREIAKADASHGWCASLMIHHPHYIGQLSEAAQAAVWADGPDVPIAAAVVPSCRITPVDGGYRLTGRSAFASGVGHSRWALIGGLVHGDGGPPDWRLFLVPSEQYEVVDTWFMSGMQGTGSNTIVTDDVFVPDDRVVRIGDLIDGAAPGGLVNDDPKFRLPFISYAPLTFTAPMLGAAQGAYEAFRDWTITRTGPGGVRIAEVTSTQVGMTRAAADIDAAELLLRRAVAVADGPEPPTLELRARSMRDFARAAELLVGAVDGLMALSGSSGFATSNVVQRAWRDIHVAGSHISLNPESNYSHAGRLELGLGRSDTQVYY